METAINYTDKTAYFSSDERKWINKIHKLKEQNPNDVVIIKEPQDNDGCIYASVPSEWFKLKPKTHKNFTEEQRIAARDRMLGRKRSET